MFVQVNSAPAVTAARTPVDNLVRSLAYICCIFGDSSIVLQAPEPAAEADHSALPSPATHPGAGMMSPSEDGRSTA